MSITWKKVSEESIFDNTFVHVVKKYFQLSDGEKRNYSIIKGRDNVQVIALTDENKIITIQQYRTGPEIVLLDIPGGGIDGNESIIKAAERELFEETGYKGIEFIEITKNYNGPTREGVTAIVIAKHCFKHSKPRKVEKQLDGIQLLDLEEFEQKLLTGGMIVSVVAAGLTALHFINNNVII